MTLEKILGDFPSGEVVPRGRMILGVKKDRAHIRKMARDAGVQFILGLKYLQETSYHYVFKCDDGDEIDYYPATRKCKFKGKTIYISGRLNLENFLKENGGYVEIQGELDRREEERRLCEIRKKKRLADKAKRDFENGR